MVAFSLIEEIKQRLDVVEVLQEYLRLQKSGTSYRALCPFHHEKTPSFFVSPDKQIWHCFGCGKGGDIFGFVQEIEGIEFPEALRILAKKAGVKLEPQNLELQNKRTRLMDICRITALFFHRTLLESSQAKFAQDYIKERAISEEMVDKFKLGYAPESWDTLQSFLLKKGFTAEEIFQSGLTIKKEKGVGYYDRFRHRLMFPIADHHGTIVGFGGRVLDKEAEPKYMNSPQTIIYNKSQILYGLDKAKLAIKKEKLAIIVEGYMDVLASHQVGVENVVASSGTALTEDQIRLLKRSTESIAIAFDADLAGEGASRRGIDLALKAGLEVKMIVIPYGKDPDECIKKDPELWKRAITKSQSIADYYFQSTLKHFDVTNVSDKKRAAKILLTVISKLTDPIEQTHYLQKLAEVIKVPEEVLRTTLQKTPRERVYPETNEAPDSVLRRNTNLQLEEGLLGMMLAKPELWSEMIGEIRPEYFTHDKTRTLYKQLVIYYTKNHEFDLLGFRKASEDDENVLAYLDVLGLLVESYAEEREEEDLFASEIEHRLATLKKQAITFRLQEIEKNLRQVEHDRGAEQSTKEKELIEEFEHLTQQLKEL